MNKYAKYIEERKGYSLIENEYGFITFGEMLMESEKVIYIEIIYVLPEHRQKQHGYDLALFVQQKAKELGYKKLLGSIDPSCVGSQESMLEMIKFGFKLNNIQDNLIWFVKEI